MAAVVCSLLRRFRPLSSCTRLWRGTDRHSSIFAARLSSFYMQTSSPARQFHVSSGESDTCAMYVSTSNHTDVDVTFAMSGLRHGEYEMQDPKSPEEV